MPEFSEAANAANASMRQNKRKGIICFDASLHDPKKRGGLTQCSSDGFGEDSATICKQNARMGLEGIHTVFEGSLHGLKSPIGKHNGRTMDLEGNHMR